MNKLRDVTLMFLVKKEDDEISHLLLAMKKRGFGVNRWNGVGGKVEAGKESIEEGAIREEQEEINILAKDLEKVGEINFNFIHNPEWDQLVHVYLCHDWKGEPSESEEMKPEWYHISEIPFDLMWPDDSYWIPEMLRGNYIEAEFKFGENDKIEDFDIKTRAKKLVN